MAQRPSQPFVGRQRAEPLAAGAPAHRFSPNCRSPQDIPGNDVLLEVAPGTSVRGRIAGSIHEIEHAPHVFVQRRPHKIVGAGARCAGCCQIAVLRCRMLARRIGVIVVVCAARACFIVRVEAEVEKVKDKHNVRDIWIT